MVCVFNATLLQEFDQKAAAHSQIAANKAMQRTMTLKAYIMLSKFTLNFLSWLKIKTAPRVPLGNWRAAVLFAYRVGTLAPGAAFIEELAGSALNPRRRNEIFPRHSF
jgi:hypothetical protein